MSAGGVSAAGAIRTAGQQIDLGAVSLGANTTIDSSNNGGSATGAIINIASVAGAARNLALISRNGATTVTGNATGIGALGLHDDDVNANGTMEFQGNLGAASLVTVARGFTVILGGGCTVTIAVSFLNTGNITLGNDDSDDFLFQNGITSTAVGINTFRGTVRTDGGAGQDISLDDLSPGGILSLNAGAGGDLVFSSPVTVPNFVAGVDINVIAAQVNAAGTSLTILDGARVNILNSTINLGTLSLSGAGSVADIGSSNFTIGTLSNLGTLRLTGLQATHAFTAFDIDSGITEYYGIGALSTVFTAGFSAGTYWDLRIAGSGAGIHSLQGAITVNNDMRIQTGVLDVTSADNYAITVSGNWQNDVGHLGFLSRAGTVTFNKPAPGTIEIRGNNTWYIFICLSAVPGLEIHFENDLVAAGIQTTQRFAVGGIFRIKGSTLANSIRLDRLNAGANPGNPPADPGDDTNFWFFDLTPGATLDMEYASVFFSNARSNPVSVPANVLATPYDTYHSFKWLDFLYAIYSYTEDSDYNGKIDRIRVTIEAAIGTLVPGPAVDFSNFVVVVDGYDIDASKGVNGYTRPVPGATFYIHLTEKTYLDTDATPEWHITRNESLLDESTGAKKVGTLSRAGGSDWMIPGDTAWPVIGYTLSMPSYNESFVHFSEPVIQAGGLSVAAGDFGAGSFTRVSGIAPTTREALVGLGPYDLTTLRDGITDLTVTATTRDAGSAPYWEIAYDGQIIGPPPPTYPDPATGYLADPNTYGSFGSPGPNPGPITRPVFRLDRGGNDVHRVSDLLISVPPTPLVPTSWSALNPDSWFIWPIWARDSGYLPGDILTFEPLTPAESASQTIGLVRAFDGSQWLRDKDFLVQSRVNPVAAPGNPTIFYDSDIAALYLSTVPGIWLPPFLEPDFSGLSGLPDLGASADVSAAIGGDLWNNDFIANDPKIHSDSVFEFWFRLSAAPNDLYAGRLDLVQGAATLPTDWYRRVRPFSIRIKDIISQKSKVTILNNVIDPTKGERTRLNYVIDQAGTVTITIFTLAGDIVRVLQRGRQELGDYTVNWDGRNLAGSPVARGMYFIRLVAPGIDEIRKVMVVKQ